MKRKLGLAAALLAAGILAAGCGAGESSAAAPSSAQSIETTTDKTASAPADTTAASPETTAAPADTTAAATEKTAAKTDPVQETDTEPPQTTASTAQSKENTGLLPALLDRLEQTTDAVSIRYEIEEDGSVLRGMQLTYGARFATEIISPQYAVKVCSDGTTTWMVHDKTKTFAVVEGESAEGMKPKDLVSEMADSRKCTGSGSEQFKGRTLRYEDYIEEGGQEADQKVRFYFDDQGNMVGGKELTGDGIEFSYEIKTVKSPDMKQFSPPADYTEISPTEMSKRVLGEMFPDMET